MIKEVLGLGIQGQDLVLSTLNKVEAAKKKFAQMSALDLSNFSKEEAKLIKSLQQQWKPKTLAEELRGEVDKAKKGKAEEQGRTGDRINEVARVATSMDASRVIEGLGQALSHTPIVGAAFGVAATLANAAIGFKDKIIQSASEYADTMSAANVAQNYSGGKDFLRALDQTTFKSRHDISVSEQRAIIEGIGSSFGRMSEDFKQSVRELYGERGGKAFDVRQTTELAKGNFAALGTDRGWFLQKISDGLRELPPSMMQKMMPQLWKSIPESDRFKQTDEGIRTTMTQFNDQQRERAQRFLGGEDTKNFNAVMQERLGEANKIQEIQNRIDSGLITAVGSLISALEKSAKMIEEKSREAAVKGRP